MCSSIGVDRGDLAPCFLCGVGNTQAVVRPNRSLDALVPERRHLLQTVEVHALTGAWLGRRLLGSLGRHSPITKLSLLFVYSILAVTLEQVHLLVGKHTFDFPNALSDIIKRQQTIEHILEL